MDKIMARERERGGGGESQGRRRYGEVRGKCGRE